METLTKLAPFAKAILAAVIASLSALLTGLQDDGLTGAEVLTAVIAGLVGLGAVFSIPNRAPFIPEPEIEQPPAEQNY